jgi:hypothetical protein
MNQATVDQFHAEHPGLNPAGVEPAGFKPHLNAHTSTPCYIVTATGVCTKCGGRHALRSYGDGRPVWVPVGKVGCGGGRFCSIERD